MNALTARLKASPLLARVLPFVVFLVLTSCQGSLGPESHFWIYLAKCVVGAWMIWVTWPLVSEMRWRISFEALLAGTLVFILWVALDVPYTKFSQPDDSWNLHKHFGSASAMLIFGGTHTGSFKLRAGTKTGLAAIKSENQGVSENTGKQKRILDQIIVQSYRLAVLKRIFYGLIKMYFVTYFLA